jgi:hypothetical protein
LKELNIDNFKDFKKNLYSLENGKITENTLNTLKIMLAVLKECKKQFIKNENENENE